MQHVVGNAVLRTQFSQVETLLFEPVTHFHIFLAVGKGEMATTANLVVVKGVIRIAKAQVVIPVYLVIECCQ